MQSISWLSGLLLHCTCFLQVVQGSQSIREIREKRLHFSSQGIWKICKISGSIREFDSEPEWKHFNQLIPLHVYIFKPIVDIWRGVALYFPYCGVAGFVREFLKWIGEKIKEIDFHKLLGTLLYIKLTVNRTWSVGISIYCQWITCLQCVWMHNIKVKQKNSVNEKGFNKINKPAPCSS